MKLFMVIYIVGQVGGSVGPLPYNLKECQRRAVEFLSEGDPTVITKEGLTVKDIRLVCEWHSEHPKIQRQ